TKKALLTSALALTLSSSMLVGTTFAWFTDSVTSTGNKIVAGTLKVDLELLGKDGWKSIKESKAPIFNYDNWEPGYTDVKILKVENEGSLALKWKAKFVSDEELSALANVIDVYVNPSETELTYPTDRTVIGAGYEYVGTVADFVNTIEETTYGTLKADGETGDEAYLGIALKMQESAGNEYQGMSLGDFDIQIVATQLAYEGDSFGTDYDEDASLNFAPVSNANELKIALANKEENIVLTQDIIVDQNFTVDYDVHIDGAGYTLCRTDGTALMTLATNEPTIYTGNIFTVKAGKTFTIENVTMDGGAVWSGEVNATLGRGTVNTGVVATGAMISTEGNANVVLGEDVVLQNHGSNSAVISLATRGNGTLTINGAKILNNSVTNGAVIWLGGATIMNDGEISGNSGTLGGIFRSVDSYGSYNVSVTVNGGKITHNTAPTGGVIWSGNSLTVTFAGGEIAYNHATSGGGVVWGGSSDKYYITGDVQIHHNTAGELGNVFRMNHFKYPSLEMTGGKVYDNTCEATPYAFYCINDYVKLTGGELKDDVLYTGGVDFTMGNTVIDGIVHFDLSTNHKRVLLAENYNTLRFTVADNAEHYANVHFVPAEGYVYSEGDEAKLVCMNEGYETYWDTATGTFRLRAK
ncbi:MAG: hypothetical protein E7381_05755, partial [Clostridiales bacterium]|nr:hypothetical protein [Clostridiales bacterium]